jgi:hypothetical protein
MNICEPRCVGGDNDDDDDYSKIKRPNNTNTALVECKYNGEDSKN